MSVCISWSIVGCQARSAVLNLDMNVPFAHPLLAFFSGVELRLPKSLFATSTCIELAVFSPG